MPGEPPSAANLAKYPKWFAAFFYKPYGGCDAEPPTPGCPSGNAYNDLMVYTLEFISGIGRFDPSNGSFTWFSEGHEVEGGFGSSVIALGSDGLLYKVVTPIGDVLQIDLDGRVLKHIKNPRPSASLALRKMPDGTLWMTDHLRGNLQKVVGIQDNLRDDH